MVAINEGGNELVMDAAKDIGGNESGFRPMSMLLAALGGCSSIDVILILKKQKQEIESFEVEIESEKIKVEEHSVFKDITVHFKLKGKIDKEKAERAIQLSIDKYCSVSKALEPLSKISYKLTLN
jgi:putative redox protein